MAEKGGGEDAGSPGKEKGTRGMPRGGGARKAKEERKAGRVGLNEYKRSDRVVRFGFSLFFLLPKTIKQRLCFRSLRSSLFSSLQPSRSSIS